MRKIVASLYISLDGVVEDPRWTFQFISDEQMAYKLEELKSADALLLGHTTYNEFAATWPGMREQAGEYGEMMHNYPKYVASSSLTNPEWNNTTILKENLDERIAELKQQPGKDILVFGSPTLIQSLTEQDLIDEYRLMTFPVLLGKGKRLFQEGHEKKVLEHASTHTFDSGVTVLTYRPAK
ncbi:Dihydrofolate reductase [Seinonella peptonophila]|uniref:Dihydrofolate reductase n=1 Tax=Seinonella peptonophila TaxID=112248 RepID=A0A1M4WNX3_9BACL|nr:dihydrofolate reductase family protein [Seinonella peptonophila]SHE82908.1 Dihydrofolate reductase [Seinonella peptonophila]